MSEYDGIPLDNARKYVIDNREDGVVCPCCDQLAKTYQRKLTSSMSVCLIELYKMSTGTDFMHLNTLKTQSRLFLLNLHGGEFSLLRFWNLIEEMPKDPTDYHKRTSGQWRITDLGRQFVEGKADVARQIWTFNAEMLAISPDKVSIQHALGKKFNYTELMSS